MVAMKWVARALIALALLIAVTSAWACTTADQYTAAWSSLTVGGYRGHSSVDGAFRAGKDFDTSSEDQGVLVSFQPLKYWEMKMQAQMTACAMTEAAYERRMAEMQAEKPK